MNSFRFSREMKLPVSLWKDTYQIQRISESSFLPPRKPQVTKLSYRVVGY